MSLNPAPITVCKRTGNIVPFVAAKIEKGIRNSATECERDINGKFPVLLQAIIDDCITQAQTTNNQITSDAITTTVKRKLMDFGYHEVAEAYILYANKQARARLEPDAQLMSDYVVLDKYARYNEELQRREVYPEICERTRNMHLKRYPALTKEITAAFEKVIAKEVLPSMRSMQFGGLAVELNHAKGYNCSFSVCNRIRFFAEAFWLLLSGTGTGFSVQFHHVDQLPEVKFIEKTKVRHYVIPDTIEGWADAAFELTKSFMTTGEHIEFAYHLIRDKNSRLKISGGKAPGHLPLKEALESARRIFEGAQGRQLKTIECYDIMCMFANAVYSGGIREAAMICLFSLDDGEMMNAKTGNWYTTHPWRQRSNNSVVLNRKDVNKRQYDRIFKATKQWGEPGFYFTDDEDTGANPCVEIGLNPKLTITPELRMQLEKWAATTERKIPKLKVGQSYWGWQQCNLTEVNCATCQTAEELYDRVRAAAVIGTLQAGYTDFPYLGWVSEAVCNREALLGVSLTGMMDAPHLALDPEIQRTAAQIAVETNIEIAARIGIKSAARVTCVKPSGTASIVVGAVGSGIHAHPAHKYFRRIRATPTSPVYQFFKKHNPHMCYSVNEHKDMIIFPIKAPKDAITEQDMTALDFLKYVLSTQKNWVIPGTAKPESSPGVNHNVSNTITVKDHEWDLVKEFLWENRKFFSGVSMLTDLGNKKFENAPRENVITEADEARWQELITNYKPVDWTLFYENDDNTNLAGEKACAGGACQLT